mgnify:CR=1 FL=1
MSKKTKNGGVSMSRLPGNRSAKFVPYLVPGLVGLLVIVVIPFVWNIYLSFTRWRGVGPVKFVGLQNWKRLFADSTFWISFANSFWIIVAIVVIPTILGLFISSLLTDVIQKKFGGKTASFLRAMFYLPQLLPVAVAAIIMGWIFRPEDGAVNALLVKLGLGFLQTIAYILVIAALVQFIEMFLKKSIPSLYSALGIYLPLITTNCAVLGVVLLNTQYSFGFVQSVVYGVFGGLGFMLAICLFASVREKLEFADYPESFEGFPICLVSAGLLALAFMGFSGMKIG